FTLPAGQRAVLLQSLFLAGNIPVVLVVNVLSRRRLKQIAPDLIMAAFWRFRTVVNREGYTVVALSLYWKNAWCKVTECVFFFPSVTTC
ncbi:hypothetical protein O5626_28965, partial [Escherichia coli]|nr:hypothetical protein [Escherichia coli]